MRAALWPPAAVLGYLAAGVAFYLIAEEKPCESPEALDAVDYDPESCAEPWTVIDSVYFSMVTMSTVGYGDLAPSSALAKAFTVFYIFLGITLVFPLLVSGVQGGTHALRVRLAPATARATSMLLRCVPDRLDDSVRFWVEGLWVDVFFLFGLQLVFAATLSHTESFAYGDAYYHSVVTATTVGYGDITLSTQSSRATAIVHIALCVVLLATLFARIDELLEDRRMEQRRLTLLTRPLNEQTIRELDRGGDRGLDKCEFVIGMLMNLGTQLGGVALQWRDVEPFLSMFDLIDKDGSKTLSMEELIQSAERCHAKHQPSRHPMENGTESNVSIVPLHPIGAPEPDLLS